MRDKSEVILKCHLGSPHPSVIVADFDPLGVPQVRDQPVGVHAIPKLYGEAADR